MKNSSHELITVRDLFTFEKRIKKKENGDDMLPSQERDVKKINLLPLATHGLENFPF